MLLPAFFIVVSLRYALASIEWQGLFVTVIPPGGMPCAAAGSALAGDIERLTERVAQIRWARR